MLSGVAVLTIYCLVGFGQFLTKNFGIGVVIDFFMLSLFTSLKGKSTIEAVEVANFIALKKHFKWQHVGNSEI